MADLEKLVKKLEFKANRAAEASEEFTANDPSGCRYAGAANAYRDAAAMVRAEQKKEEAGCYLA